MKNRLLPHQCVLEHGEGHLEVFTAPNNTMTMNPSMPGWRVLKGIQAIAIALIAIASILKDLLRLAFSLGKPHSPG